MIGLNGFATFRDWSAKPPLLRSEYAERKSGFEGVPNLFLRLFAPQEARTTIFSRRRNQ
jgi:hypothetical protein